MPPKTLKDFVHQFKNKKKILELQEHIDEERTKQSSKFGSFLNTFLADFQSSKFGSFLNTFLADILVFSAALIITLVAIYVVCRQSKLKNLVANIALEHVKGIEATDTRFQEI